MALYHFHVEQIKRSEGRTAVASAAYRAGEELHNLWDGETHDYTKKGGVILSEIMLPKYAPERFSDRYILWNEVEQIEKHYKAQLAYSFDMALQNEFSLEENIALAREFVQKYLKPILDEMKKEKYCFTKAKERYKAEHESELRRFYMVKRKLKESGFEKDPFPLDAWQKEFSELSAQRKAEYQEYKLLQKDLTIRKIYFPKDHAAWGIRKESGSHNSHERSSANRGGMALVFLHPFWKADDHSGHPR